MRRYFPFYVVALLLSSLIAMMGVDLGIARAQDIASPTPTYDPLVEPIVPENPTDYELGRNWYWHHCMPCHGDKGQGLTDEWRATWEPDHQDCWGRGCHAGERFEDSFTIPTIVPPVASSSKLARFSSLQTLYEYLKATHPPQYPGHLDDEQYHAIAVFVFSMNDRPVEEFIPTPTMTPTIALSSTNTQNNVDLPMEQPTGRSTIFIYLGLGIILVVAVMWGIRKLRGI